MGIACISERRPRKNDPSKQTSAINNEKNYEEPKEEKQSKPSQKNEEKKRKEIKNLSKKEIELKNIGKELLNQHNDIRKKFACPLLNLNYDLKKMAQKFADNFDILKESNFFNYNYHGEPIGINYEKFKEDISDINKICQKWINEKKYYQKGNDPKIDAIKYNSKTKHFSQIIWKKTKDVGFGYSQLSNGEKIFVAFYYPAGNIFNEFNENISIKNLT